jgi:hypothetical protein
MCCIPRRGGERREWIVSSAYCTQIDSSGSGGMRCGPASCASVLLSEGWQSDPWALTAQLDAQCDPHKDGTTSNDLLTLMDGYGFAGGLWYSWEDAQDCWRNGQAVLCLLDNSELEPRAYPPGDNWNAMHWIRILVEAGPDGMTYAYDPLTWMVQPDGRPYQGPTVYTSASIMRAIQTTAYPEAGISLVSPSGRNLNT